MVLLEQIEGLLDFLEVHRELALGHCNRTAEGRNYANRLWTKCADILNSISSDGHYKSPAQWRVYYNEYKSKLLRKIKSQKREMNATGGGPPNKLILTALQERLYNILGKDVGEPLPGVQHNPLSHSITLPSTVNEVDFGPSKENNSFLIVEQHNEPYVHSNNMPPIEATSEILMESHIEEVAKSNTMMDKNRRRKRAQHYPSEDEQHAALKAAQEKIDANERLRAEATLEHARATNNLAAAANRLASAIESIGHIIGNNAKKKPCRRRIAISSESETDDN